MTLVPGIGLDLGSARLRALKAGKGVVLDEPTVVAVDGDGRVVAVGDEARATLGRNPASVRVVRPVREGVISDYTHTLKLLDRVLDTATGVGRSFGFRPAVLFAVPSAATGVERRAAHQALRRAGARPTVAIDVPIAAALGADLDIGLPKGVCVVDLGANTTNLAVLSMKSVAVAQSLRIGGARIDDAIARHLRAEHGLLVGESTAEDIKLAAGIAYPQDEERRTVARGRDLATGMPREVDLAGSEIRRAIVEPLRLLAERICLMLEETTPELASDIAETGIVLTGGGANLPGLASLFHQLTQVPVRVAPRPEHAVVRGLGKLLDRWDDPDWSSVASPS